MAKFNGDLLIIEVDTGTGLEPVALAQDSKMAIDVSQAKATTKDSGGWEENIPGNAKWTVDTNGLVDFHPSTGYHGCADLIAACANKTLVTVNFTPKTTITGDVVYSGAAYVTKCELNAKQGEAATYTASFEGTGALTITTK